MAEQSGVGASELLAGLHIRPEQEGTLQASTVRQLSPLSLCLPLVPFALSRGHSAHVEAGLDALGGEHPLGRRLSCDTAC